MLRTSIDVARPGGPDSKMAPTILQVCTWSWRRLAAQRRWWGVPVLVGLAAFGVTWLDSYNINLDRVDQSAALGTYFTFFIVSVILSLVGIAAVGFAPGVIANDLEARMHDLLMATSLGNRAYVWGRFLAWSLACLALTVVAVVGAGASQFALHLTSPQIFDAPSWQAYALAWCFNAPMHAVFAMALAFSIGTRYPRLARATAIGGALLWWMISVGALSSAFPPVTYPWLPVPREIANALYVYYQEHFRLALAQAGGSADVVTVGREVARLIPDLSIWWSQMLYPLAALILVEGTARRFDRFRHEESAWN